MIRKILSFFLCAISYLNAASGSNPVSEDAEIFRLPGGTEISTSSVDTGDTGDTRIFMAVQLLEQFKLVLQDPNFINPEEESIVEKIVRQNQQLITPQERLFVKYENRMRPDGVIEKEFKIYRLVLKSAALKQVSSTSDIEERFLVLIKEFPRERKILKEVEVLEQFKLVLQDPNSIEGKSIIEQSVEQNLRQSVEQAIELKKTLFLDHEDRIRPNGATEIQFILYGSIS